jgi:lysophospholipase L1-like esterase
VQPGGGDGRNVKTAIFYVIWVALMLEVVSRVLVLQPEVSGFNRIFFTPLAVQTSMHPSIFQQRILWISDPDQFEFVHTLNLYGFRGSTFPIDKIRNRRRVVFIGDSFMEGFGADDEHTIPTLVERQAGGRIESINLGVGAAGLDEYADIARVSMPLLKPDVVVLTIYQNDLPANGYKTAKSVSASVPTPVPESAWHLRFLTIVESFWRKVPLPTRFHQGRHAFFRPVPDATNPLSRKTSEEVKTQTKAADPLVAAALKGRFNPSLLGVLRPTEESLKLELNEHNGAIQYLRAIKAATDAVGAKLLVVYIPLHVTVSDYYYPFWNELGEHFLAKSLTGPEFRKQQAHLRSCANELGLEFLDTTSRIQEIENAGTHLYHRYDSHMNAEGYGTIANMIRF